MGLTVSAVCDADKAVSPSQVTTKFDQSELLIDLYVRRHTGVTCVAKVLVVEDEVLISMVIEDALRDAGYTVVTAANAADAIRELEADTAITLVFTDVDMPGTMDGLKLAAYVHGRWPPVHIIIASGKRRPLATEMPDHSLFFAKPYSTGEVVSAIGGFHGA